MFGFIKDRREKKRKQEQEQKLKKSLAEKVSLLEDREKNSGKDDTDYTEMMIDGERVKVKTERITIKDPASYKSKKKHSGKTESQ